MRRPRLVVVTDTQAAPVPTLLERVERVLVACRPSSVLVQLRDKELPIRDRLKLGRELRSRTRARGQLFSVNDRLDVARLLDADGVHLTETSVDTEDARKLLGPDVFVSRAAHDPSALPDADAVLLSPIFAERKGRRALGVAALRRASSLQPTAGERPALYALGGVDAARVPEALAAGAVGVAVVGAVVGSDDPQPLLHALGLVV